MLVSADYGVPLNGSLFSVRFLLFSLVLFRAFFLAGVLCLCVHCFLPFNLARPNRFRCLLFFERGFFLEVFRFLLCGSSDVLRTFANVPG